MTITAIPHYDNILGNGYYLVTEFMDKTWFKGATPEDAATVFLKQFNLSIDNVKIIERK